MRSRAGNRRLDWSDDHKPAMDPINFLEDAGERSLSKRFPTVWVLGIVILLPLDTIKLPFNITLVDIWALIGMVIFWPSFVVRKQPLILSYTTPMWLILAASFASTFYAPVPRNSLIAILKEIFAFVWFITLATILSTTNARDLRRILGVWSGVVFLHGAVIVAQFLSPAVWRFIASFAGNLKDYELYRPHGLFGNANAAAFYQLLGFVPLILVSGYKKATMVLGLLLFLTIILTGSMGATVAFLAGLTVILIAVSLSGYVAFILRSFLALAVIISLLGGLFYFIVSYNQRYREHFEHIFYGRSERSSEGRFSLWQRGMDAFVENEVFFWGIGPENFRVVDGRDTQLHSDLIAFSVERGMLGVLGLMLFALLAVNRAAYMIVIHNKHSAKVSLAVIVFLGAMIAVIVESLTHQMFHFRTLWVVLAFQEAILYKIAVSEKGIESTAITLSRSLHPLPESVAKRVNRNYGTN